MTTLAEKKLKAIEAVLSTGNRKRMELLKVDNTLDHVSWSAMAILIHESKEGLTSLTEEAHITNMANHVGMSREEFIIYMDDRIEKGTIMATGVLVAVNTALAGIKAALNQKNLDDTMSHFSSFINFFGTED